MEEKKNEQVPNELELAQALLKAAKSGNTAQMKTLSEQIARSATNKIVEATKAKQVQREALTVEIKAKVTELYNQYQDKIADAAGNGLWFSKDFETTELTISLLKPAKKASVGAKTGRTGKTGTKSAELLQLYGTEASDVENMSWQQLWDSNTDGNFRYYKVKAKLDQHHQKVSAKPE